MLDFFHIIVKETKEGLEVRPDFVVGRSKDLMVQGGDFYAVWDEEAGLWSRDKYRVVELVDNEIRKFVEAEEAKGLVVKPKYLRSFANGGWKQFNTFLKNVSDNSHPLDTTLTFASTKVKKEDHASRRLSYDMAPGDISAYEQLVSKLYAPEEREKYEWGLGSIIAGDAKKIQKFFVFFGDPGTGKSTIMDIAKAILGGRISDGGYVETFEAQGLVGGTNAFSMEPFRANPLLALQHDADLSRIADNSKLNSVVSHEDMTVNEKYKATYSAKINAQLWLGSNKEVKITDGRSGLVRRLIDVNPTGERHDIDTYLVLTERVNFELGAIAHHCLQVYRRLGKNYYSKYVPEQMIKKTNVFYNYVEYYHETFSEEDGITLKRAFDLWKNYCKEAELEFKMPLHRFREELKLYFESFAEGRSTVNGVVVSSYFSGFKADKFKAPIEPDNPKKFLLVLEHEESLLDELYAGLPAQYAGARNNPKLYWTNTPEIDGVVTKVPPEKVCSTVLGDLDTTKLHFLRVPKNHIVVDFDLTDENGKKSLELNLEAAAAFPPTYAELSKSGGGVHLHYLYDGDVDELAAVYSPGIEVKVYRGSASLRRKVSKCNNVAVATISSGLPFKEKKDMLKGSTLKSEKGLRALILKALRKEIPPHSTKTSVDFIEHILNQAYQSGVVFDVTDLKKLIIAFANESTNQSAACFKTITKMKFKSELTSEEVDERFQEIVQNEKIVFFDCEVYPNLFVICWKYHDGDPNSLVRMINPTPQEVEKLITHFKLVGFNNRDYDNHILYARYMGYTNEQLYELSQRIIVKKDRTAKFADAYNLSYADVYDFSVKKQGLKAWEIELGGKHMEMNIPWDQPVPPDMIMKVVEYCCNDVVELERVFNHLHQDFVARQILSDLSGLPVNSTTRNHSGRIIFGMERNPQREFVYTDLSETFPGYKYDKFAPEGQKSTYKGEFVGEGGYVYAEPGVYDNVVCLDVASMHPTSIEELRLFGRYTVVYSAIKEARLAIKGARVALGKYIKTEIRDFFDEAAKLLSDAKLLFQGRLRPHIEEIEQIEDLKERVKALKALEDALKLVINSVYGYTSAKFENLFRDPRNIDNIVAKRGALFMIELKLLVQSLGYQVVHIKTDSIKIPNADASIIREVEEFGRKYGYEFEVEGTYKKFCLVNDAVYVAQEEDGQWTATGAQFQHPYVFSRLFSQKPISFQDLCEKKQVKEGVMYLDDINLDIYGDEYAYTFEPDQQNKSEGELVLDYDGRRYHIGRTGLFVPVVEELGGRLIRVKDGKEFAVTGTKGFYWVEAEMLRTLKPEVLERMQFERVEDAVEGTGSIADVINLEYFEGLVEKAISTIGKFGDYYELVGKSTADTASALEVEKMEIAA